MSPFLSAGTLTLGLLEEQTRHLSSCDKSFYICSLFSVHFYIRDSNLVKKTQLGSVVNFTFGTANYHSETKMH